MGEVSCKTCQPSLSGEGSSKQYPEPEKYSWRGSGTPRRLLADVQLMKEWIAAQPQQLGFRLIQWEI